MAVHRQYAGEAGPGSTERASDAASVAESRDTLIPCPRKGLEVLEIIRDETLGMVLEGLSPLAYWVLTDQLNDND